MNFPFPMFWQQPIISSIYDSATTAWINQVITNGGTVSTAQKGYVDTLITGLKADGIWTLLDRLWLFASENTQQAVLDIVNRQTTTNVNSPTFTANRGYAGNGTSSYIDTNFNPGAGGHQFALYSAHLSVYDRTARSSGGTAEIGANDASATQSFSFIQPYSFGNASFALSDAIGDAIGGAVTNAQGFFLATRTGPNALDGYRNGANLATASLATAFALATHTVFVGARNNNGTPISYSTDQIAAVSIGGGLFTSDAVHFSGRINAYMTSIGANVY